MNNLDSTLRRRQFLTQASGGVGLAGLAGLLSVGDLAAEAQSTDPFAVKAPHFPAKAKNLIFLYMEGAPSQIDLLDPKPALAKWHGEPLPPSMTKDFKFAFIKPNAKVLGCKRPFARYGQSGAEFSDWVSAWGPIADDLCIVRSMHTDAFNHQPADRILFTGHMLAGRPTLGSWVLYGLGSESRNLPGFVVLSTGKNNMSQGAQWTSGFLPSNHQGVLFRRTGDPVLYLSNPKGVTAEQQGQDFGLIGELDKARFEKTGDREIASRMASYEMAARMQLSTPELLDLSKET